MRRARRACNPRRDRDWLLLVPARHWQKERHLRRGKPRRSSLKYVDAELAQIGPFLLDAKPDASVTLKERDSGVKIRAASHGGLRLILLANPTDTAREVPLEFAATPDGVLKPIGQGTNVASRGGIVKVKLEASGTAALLE